MRDGTSKRWNFDSIGWWACAVHQSASHIGTFLNGVTPRWKAAESDFCLLELSQFYGETLRLLAEGSLSTGDAYALLLRAKSLRKWRFANPDHATTRRKEAIRGFLRRNERASAVEFDTPRVKYLAAVMRRILKHWLPEPERLGWSWTGRFGPGAVAEKLSHIRRFEQLADWVYPCRHDQADAGRRWELNQQWPYRPPHALRGQHSSARLHAVPKQFDKDRLITIEPSYNSFCQAYAREAVQCSIHLGPLAGTCMDLYYTDGQAIQRRLALKASLDKKNATVDLSDASDLLSKHLIESVFPSWVCALLDVSRSPYFTLDEEVDGVQPHRDIPMWIYAGMGNGTTFTIETLFFAALVTAYAEIHGLPGRASVFGDDVICHSTTALRLTAEGFPFFVVNKQKSFMGDDALRESCGIFAYNGEDITAPRIDGYPNTWEGRLAVVDLWTRLYRSSHLEDWELSYYVAEEATRSGIDNWGCLYEGYPSISDPRVPYSCGPQTRYNKRYQRAEAQVLMPRLPTRSFSHDWRVCKHYNLPAPEVWYLANMCGMLGSGDNTINSVKTVVDQDGKPWCVSLDRFAGSTRMLDACGKTKYEPRWVRRLA